jgi:hypothetical protein
MRTATRVFIAGALVFGSGCAQTDWIDRTLVTVDLAGVWSGKAYIAHAATGLLIDVRMELEQAGPKVKGSIRPSGSIPWRDLDRSSTAGSLEGTVAGDVFEFKETNGHVKGRLTVSGDGDEMAGEVVERATYWVVLRRAR